MPQSVLVARHIVYFFHYWSHRYPPARFAWAILSRVGVSSRRVAITRPYSRQELDLPKPVEYNAVVRTGAEPKEQY